MCLPYTCFDEVIIRILIPPFPAFQPIQSFTCNILWCQLYIRLILYLSPLFPLVFSCWSRSYLHILTHGCILIKFLAPSPLSSWLHSFYFVIGLLNILPLGQLLFVHLSSPKIPLLSFWMPYKHYRTPLEPIRKLLAGLHILFANQKN